MKAWKFTDAQKAFVIKQGEGVTLVAEVSPAIDARFSYRGEDDVATLERTCRKVGYLKTIRVDNGSEFVSRDIDLWAYQRGGDARLLAAWKPIGSCRWKRLARRKLDRRRRPTTKSDRTARSERSPRSCWQTRPGPPALRTRARRKTLDPSGPRSGSSAISNVGHSTALELTL
jgi:hypothetical protein